MKIFWFILLFFQPGTGNLFAQNGSSGLFLNAEDFLNKKLTQQSNATRIKAHELFKTHVVEVKYHDSLFVYEKKNVFGYADKEGVYRFADNKVFPILNPGEQILLYKRTSGNGMKNSPIVETFYFSKDAYSVIQLLTLSNMFAAFASDTAFTQLIEICFTRDSELMQYDALHRKYRINRLLEIAHQH